MSRFPLFLVLTLVAACAGGAAGPPAQEPGATPPAAPPPPPEEGPRQPGTPDPDTPDADTPDDGDPAPGNAEAEAVGVRRLGRWAQSGLDTPERFVIRDDTTFSALWGRIGAGEKPVIDFGRELVVVAAAGPRPTGGHSISVSRAVLWEGTLMIEVLQTTPAPDCVVTQALTHPVDVVAIPAEGVERWQFADREEVGGCGE